MRTRWRLAKNAVANLMRAGTAGFIALFMPALLVRHMQPPEYAVWALVLQIAAYTAYLDFGLSTAVGRYIAFANETCDTQQRDAVFSTAFIGLSVAGIISVVLFGGAALWAGELFPKLPASLLPPMRGALLIVGVSAALGLPASAWSGIFVGLQKYEVPALATGATKLAWAAVLTVVVVNRMSILAMAVVTALINLVSYAALYRLATRYAPETALRCTLVTWSTVKELARYCFGLTIWSFSAMVVLGLDLILVARFQIQAVAAYAVAASLVTFVAGAQTAIFNVMMPLAAAMHAQQNATGLGKLVVASTRGGVLLLVVTGMPLLIFAKPLLAVWVGPQYATEASPIVVVLLIANMVRLIGVSYSVAVIGTGQQGRILLTPVTEALVNLLASILLGIRFGALGVAWGTLLGAVTSIGAHLAYSIPRTGDAISIPVRDYAWRGVCLPATAIIPFLFIQQWSPGMSPWTSVLSTGIVSAATLAAFLYVQFRGETRLPASELSRALPKGLFGSDS